MSFSLQEKLALIRTSAGSMRNAAALIGISHQKMGRWLREGEEGGVIAIPDDIATVAAINQAFSIHKNVVREQNIIDGVPFNKAAPVYLERKPLRTGFMGDRVISGKTEFIRSDLRQTWIRAMTESERFYKINVRSVIDLKSYFDQRAAEELARDQGRRYITKKQLSLHMLNAFVAKEKRERKHIIDKTIPLPLYTQSELAWPGADPYDVAAGIEFKLNQKHSGAVGPKGTHFAEEYLLQLLPEGYVKSPTGWGGHAPTPRERRAIASAKRKEAKKRGK